MLSPGKPLRDEIFAVISREEKRQTEEINLIASENYSSDDVRRATGSVLAHKYAEGYPAKRWYGGCRHVDEVEEIARDLVKRLFGAEHANVQPHCGASANLIVYSAFLKPGDKVLSLVLSQGGHLSHGSPANLSGKEYQFVHYPLERRSERVDYAEMERLAAEHQPKIVLAGYSAYPREVDWKRVAEIAHANNALAMADVAHTAGIIAAGHHQTPFPHMDIVTTTTHKSLRGPRGAVIMCREKFAKEIDHCTFPGFQGGPFMHEIAAKAVCFNEAHGAEFKAYQGRVLRNAKTLEEKWKGFGGRLCSGGTDCHFILLDVKSTYGITGQEGVDRLAKQNIAVNKNAIPYDTESIFKTSGLRIGTPFMTSRGWDETRFAELADRMHGILGAKG
ncbi:MAG: serine hydroxymethyltransferase [Planctomycetes bacterium]|nr:serine hydroxymethyltransferase [Planctomycetota bacterium]